MAPRKAAGTTIVADGDPRILDQLGGPVGNLATTTAPRLQQPARPVDPRNPKVPIDSIKVGERFRRDMGDIEGFARNVAVLGVLQPIGITPDKILVFGYRRLLAAKVAGLSEVPIVVVDLERIVEGEYAENVFRKDFTPSEIVAIADAIEPIEREKAKARQGQRTDKRPEKFPGSSGNALDKVATVAGVSRPTLVKARAVVQAAEAEPARFGSLVGTMDATGRVDRAYKQLQIARRQQEHAAHIEHGCTVRDLEVLGASGKRFRLIYADPPWHFETWAPSGKIKSPDNHYITTTTDEIKALPVAPLAADNAVLLMWCTWPHIAIGSHLEVIRAWGFKPSTAAFVWIKQTEGGEGLHTGTGYWTLANSEVCLLATKGAPTRLAADVHQVVLAPVGEHSAKPEEVRRRIERLVGGPYLELYGRRPVDHWHVWGNEIPHADFPPYDADDDIRKSVTEGFAAIRERQAAGGPEWKRHDVDAASLAPNDPGDIPDFLKR
jgi:N6-adenosine-specific RNA methylase IME4